MHILGVQIDNLTRAEIINTISSFLKEQRFHHIVTVNPEFILEAQKNAAFQNVLNGADLHVADGVGIWYAFLRYAKLLRSRFAGADLMYEILKIANDKKLGVFLALNRNGLSTGDDIKRALKKRYPDIQLYAQEFDPKDPETWTPKPGDYRLMLCNFGAPNQEIFLNTIKNDTIQIAMGVGGSFDFITGKIRRAPKLMQIFGLEWLWRLMLEPRYRIKRIYNAVIVFPIRILMNTRI